MMKNSPVVAASLLLALSIGCKTSVQAGSKVPIRPVALVQVSDSAQDSGEQFAALLVPEYETVLAFRVPGFVTQIYRSQAATGILHEVEPGDVIPSGVILARLRSGEYEAARDQGLQSAGGANAEVDAAAAQVDQLKAKALQAENDFLRTSKLWSQQSATQPAYDSSLAQRDAARSAVAAAESNLVGARHRAVSAVAESSAAQFALKDTTLINPYPAVLVSRRIERGGLVQAGTEVMTVADMRRMKAQLNVPDTLAGTMHEGQVLKLSIAGLNDEELKGTVLAVSRVADAKSRSFEVQVLLDNHAGLLRAGMIATAFVPGRASQHHLAIPVGAAIHDAVSGNYKVFVASHEGLGLVARERSVRLAGLSGGLMTLENTTLDCNDFVVADGGMLLHDGDRIEDQATPHPEGMKK